MAKSPAITEYVDIDFLQKSREFLDLIYPLAIGPNRYKSLFGKVLEGVVRKDYFTLSTIVYLVKKVKSEPECLKIFAGSILDLSRRALEDMVYMTYIDEKGKEEYSKRFIQYDAVEQKDDMDFMDSVGMKTDEEIAEGINKRFAEVPRNIKEHRNWAGLSVDQAIDWFAKTEKFHPTRGEFC